MSEQLNLKDATKKIFTECAADPVYFMKKFCYIQHPVKGKVLFQLYQFQEKTLAEFKKYDRNIVLKSRQMGISTLVAGYSLWLMLFNTDKNILVIATKQETAKNLVTKVKEMYEGLPSFLKVKCTENNRLSIRFVNGSQIKAVASSADAARSEALSLLVIDEAAHIDIADDIWTSAQATLSTGGKAILLSTPNGIGNFFHRIWTDAENGVIQDGKGFNPIKLKWNLHPDRDQKWRDQQDVELGAKFAGQECDCDFITSGNTVIDSNILLQYQKLIIDPIELRGPGEELWIFKRSEVGKGYIVSADVARGDGSDYSTFQILEIEEMEQVAEFKAKIDTKEFGHILVSLATEYNHALLIVENATIGHAVIQQIIDEKYNNLFYSTDELSQLVVNPEKKFTNRLNAMDRRAVPGFTNSSKTRPMIISKLDLYMREGSVILHSKRLNDELFTFIWDNGKAKAMDGYNDDLCISLAIGLWIRDTALLYRNEAILSTKKCIEGIHKSVLPSQTFFTPSNKVQIKDPWKMSIGIRGKPKDEDLTWLL